MAGQVQAWTPLGGDPDDLSQLLSQNPGQWLPPPASPRGPGHWAFTANAGPVTRIATCMVGQPQGGDGQLVRQLRWEPDPEPDDPHVRVLPTFDGEILLRDAGGRAEIHLQGEYRPPTGRVGAILNHQQVHDMAEAVVRNFLDIVITRLLGDDEDDG